MSSSSSEKGRCIGRLCGEKMAVPGMKFAPYAEAFCGKACEKDSRLCKMCIRHMESNLMKGTKKYHGTRKNAIPNWSHIMGSKKTLTEMSRLGLTMANLEDKAAAAEKAAAKAARNAEEAAAALAIAKEAKKAEKEMAKARRATKKVSSNSKRSVTAPRAKTVRRPTKAENIHGMFNPFDPKATAMPPSPEAITEIRKKLPGYGVSGVRPTKNGYKMVYVPASRVSSGSSNRSAFAVTAPAPAPVGGAGTGAMEPSMENLLAELGMNTELQ